MRDGVFVMDRAGVASRLGFVLAPNRNDVPQDWLELLA